MRTFDYMIVPRELEATEITNLLLAIREYKGKQELWRHARPDVLTALLDIAKIQSTEASNRIEGIVTTRRRLDALMAETTTPQNRAEGEIAGYRDVLALIHERSQDIPVTPNVVLQLHRDMLGHVDSSYRGRWKDVDNEIVAVNAQGERYVRFRPMPALLTPTAIEGLCRAYNDAWRSEICDPLLLAIRFVFDFVSIHPFNDGNGRMSRLLTVLLMERSGYAVSKYISIEKRIEQNKGLYYDALAASSENWLEGSNREAPFVRFMLGVVLRAYRDLEERVTLVGGASELKGERVLRIIEQSVVPVSKAMILEQCPDISEITVKRALSDLQKAGRIEKVGAGRATAYQMPTVEN